ALERRRHESRALSVFPDDDGMYVVRGRLPAEVGALLMRAVEAASDALYREKKVPQLKAETDTERQRAAAQRRADALGLLAERALAAGFGGRNRAGQGTENGEEAEPGAEDNADDQIPISGTRAERYQVVLHVEPETLKAEGEPGRSELEDGTNVSAETSRRLSCDAALVRVSHAPDKSILNVGRRTRTISPALRRALEFRDRGCRFPGCGLRFAEAHHVTHWADGGETSLENTLLACKFHHRLLHEGGWKVDWWGPGRPVFFDPRGGTHFDGRWTPPEVGERPVAALIEQNHLRGARPDGRTVGARWKREADIPDPIYLRAIEAVGEAGR
ncbi:MAG: HNH endonuclease, partial [Desulfobacterales bacterium]|nr:HNH endonuclease [Desulfobacterales bacterium]